MAKPQHKQSQQEHLYDEKQNDNRNNTNGYDNHNNNNSNNNNRNNPNHLNHRNNNVDQQAVRGSGGAFNDQRYKSAPFPKPQVYMTSLDATKKSKTEKMQGNQLSDAFPQRSTYREFLDVRTNPKKPWKRRYFVLSNNFLLCGATPYCETLERVTALEGSKIELCMARSQIQTQMESQSQTQNQEPHQTNKNSKNNNIGNTNNNNNNNSNDRKRR